MGKPITFQQIGQDVDYPLNAAYVSNGLVFSSGSVGSKEDGTFSESVEDQTTQAILNLQKVLKAAGSDLNRVVKTLVFINHAAVAAQMNKVYAQYFPQKPARSCVIVQFPDPRLKVEIECVAELN